MLQFPDVNHKLPELFRIIIATDHVLEKMLSMDVVDLKKWTILREDRRRYSQAAEKFVQRQRGSNP